MTLRAPRMIRRAADGGPRTRMAFQDTWTAIRQARTIIQDRWMTLRDRGPRSGTRPGRGDRIPEGSAVIGVIHEPRGEDVAGLIYYLYGPGRHEEHPTRISSQAGAIRPSWSRRCAPTGRGTSGN